MAASASPPPAQAVCAPPLPDLTERLARLVEAATPKAASLRQTLSGLLAEFEERAERDPYTNPIALLALEIRRMRQDGAVSEGDLRDLVQALTAKAFAARAVRSATYLLDVDQDRNLERLRTMLDGVAARTGFEGFQRLVESELFGIVMTAHPTFGVTGELLTVLAELVAGTDQGGSALDDSAVESRLRQALEAEHRPDQPLDLMREHALSLTALAHAQKAVRTVYRTVFAVARAHWPDRWTDLTPRLITLATWVGYDLDGRSDIRWTDTLTTRLKVQALQLGFYGERVAEALGDCGNASGELRATLELLEARLNIAQREALDEIEVFSSADYREAEDRERIRLLAKRMAEGRPRRLVSTEPLVELIGRAMQLAGEGPVTGHLAVLRAEVANHGLGMAHTHVRLNSIQLHNAIRKSVGIESPPDDPGHKRSYLSAMDGLLDSVQPQTINFGSILSEKASAKRLIMVVAQMLKYVDASTPVRFLIAECEAAATLLSALYFARMFGIEDSIDISPLFETGDALHKGAQMIEDALANPHWRAYVQRRGRICVQMGFSDSGRFLGQTAAGWNIEILRHRIAGVLSKAGLSGIEVVVFNTHGESIGRGAHPASFLERLRYVATPSSRGAFAKAGLRLKEEISFQGGDGYLPFMTAPTALAVVTRILDYATDPASSAPQDSLYDDPGQAAEFFTTIRLFNERIMDDPNTAALLDVFGTNLLWPSGSRAVRRQSEGGKRVDLTHPSQLRAIPQNAIYQQMGMLANTLGGLGHAITKDPEGFQRLYQSSARFRSLVSMAEYAMQFSDLNVLRAYVDILDPGRWLMEASREADHDQADRLRHVSDFLERMDRHHSLVRIQRRLQKDFADLSRHLAFCRVEPDGCAVTLGPDSRETLKLLHALRIALIEEIYLLAMRVPEFSWQLDTTPDDMLSGIIHLEVDEAVARLRKIFPRTESLPASEDFGEPASYQSDRAQSYVIEHETIFDPLSRIYGLVRRVGSAVSHVIGAVG